MKQKTKAERDRLLRYGAAGLSTTLLNIFLFRILSSLMPEYRTANLIAIVITKIYGYFANKLYVFRSRNLTPKRQLREVITYAGSRIFSGCIDYFGLILLVSYAGMESFPAKVIVQGLVIFTNYVLGKYIVFQDVK